MESDLAITLITIIIITALLDFSQSVTFCV